MDSTLIIISAGSEWRAVKRYYQPAAVETSPFGEYFEKEIANIQLIFFQGGWGKISAAASAQFAISQFQPCSVINLGTCGGFEGQVERGEIILYDTQSPHLSPMRSGKKPSKAFHGSSIGISDSRVARWGG